MTENEAIKQLKDILGECTESEEAVCYVTGVDIPALEMAINALEKQIPKKLKEHTQSQYGCIPVCGVCNGIMDLMQGDLNYCPNCGQKLDWSE